MGSACDNDQVPVAVVVLVVMVGGCDSPYLFISFFHASLYVAALFIFLIYFFIIIYLFILFFWCVCVN